MSALREAWAERPLCKDGALATELARERPDVLARPGAAELLCRDAPERVQAVHRAYVEAGADVLTTNTFGAAEHALPASETGASERLLARGVELAAAHGLPVLGSLGPGPPASWQGSRGRARLSQSWRRAARVLARAGAHGVVLETLTHAALLEAALEVLDDLRAARPEVAVLASLSVDARGRLAGGEPVEEAVARALERAPAPDLVALNCSCGPRALRAPLERLAERVAPLAVGVWPNAGAPGRPTAGPEEFARELGAASAAVAARLRGGCCGTGPAHIRALAARDA